MSFLNIFASRTTDVQVNDDYDVIDVQQSNIGENGTLQLTEDEVGDIRLVLFSHLCRNTPIDKIHRLLNIYFSQITDENREEMITDLFVIIFEKRDCRGGEGEKLLFRQMLNHAEPQYHNIVIKLLSLVPEYGSWMDMWQLAGNNEDVTNEIYRICAEQINKDRIAKVNDITLCAKWSPSEGTEHYKRLTNIVDYLRLINPTSTTLQKDYRKTINDLRRKIVVAEQLMCDGRYADIDPTKTPSVCANKNRKAFLNISLDNTKPMDYVNGNRYPDRRDRVLARQRWLRTIKEGKVKGGQLDPMTLVRAVRSTTDMDEINLINCQWNDLVAKTRKQIEKALEDGYEPMNNIIPMIDRSGSMAGTPEIAAVGLGILLAELCNPRYGNIIMTFATTPSIIQLDSRLSFSERVNIVTRMEVGYTTDFEKAMNLVCNIVREKKLTQEELPSLCILTDEQMNHGNMFGYSETVDNGIKTRFEELGREIHGTPFERPRTVHWNLRGDTEGYPVTAHENNVQAITGYSASLLDLILTGKPAPTPYETMRRKLDGSRYDAVREVVRGVLTPKRDAL
jgi:uncharacterized protein (UPF0297 family)